jgi:hypothetical protein
MREFIRLTGRIAGYIAAIVMLSCAVASAQEPAQSTETEEKRATMFPKGTWTSQFHAAYFHSIVDDEDVDAAVASVGYYFDDRHVFRVEAVGYYFDEEGPNPDAEDSLGSGLNVGLRYHFLEYKRVSLFIDGIAGLFYANRNFPEGGTHFNFNEQLGLGVTFRLGENTHLISGARFMHISNARIHGEDENPSYDALGGYIGVMFTF